MNLVRTSTRVAACAVVCVTGSALLATGPVAQAEPRRDAAVRQPALQTIDLTPGPAWARAASASHNTRPFSLLGATWTDPRAVLDGMINVRTRAVADGRWSAWYPLEADEQDAGTSEPGTRRGGTDPLWVGASNAVEARVVTVGDGTRPLPAGLRLDLINPDENAAEPGSMAADPTGTAATGMAREDGARKEAVREDAAQESAIGKGAATARTSARAHARPLPPLISRARWGADESIVTHQPQYTTDVQVLFVHHTATSNDYNCGQSASIIRGIERYHVRSKGWNDIGYNFLVDKCGTLFEGRRGGASLPVLGAHTLGFNAHSAAIAVIGNYDSVGVPATVRSVIAEVAAYKIGMYGHTPSSRVVLTSGGSDRYPAGTRVALNRVSGHRDTGRTDCPGDALYGQLGTIRALASEPPQGLTFLRMNGAERIGSFYFTRGAISPLWTLRTPSSSIDYFQVLVDGVVQAAVARGNRTYLLHLAEGRHSVTVRAIHLNGRTAIATARVIADASGPVFTGAPDVTLRRGSLQSSVPIRLGYTVADNYGVRGVALTAPSVRDLGTAPRTWTGFARFATATTWSVRALDWAGNTTTASVTRTPVVLSVGQAARTGSWRTLKHSAYLGGEAAISTSAGSRLTWTFTGSTAQLAVTRTPASGRLRVYLDGQYAGVVDLRSAGVAYRYAVIAPSWPVGGSHTLTVSVEGTAGRPGVIVEALVGLG